MLKFSAKSRPIDWSVRWDYESHRFWLCREAQCEFPRCKKGLKMHPALELTLSGARVVGPSEVLTVSSEGTVRGASQCETGELDT